MTNRSERDALRAEVDRLRADLRALTAAARPFTKSYVTGVFRPSGTRDQVWALADVLARVEDDGA